ncbi:MAG: hypothetical protein ACI80L_001950 [Pseudohongiellaceae bacterium]
MIRLQKIPKIHILAIEKTVPDTIKLQVKKAPNAPKAMDRPAKTRFEPSSLRRPATIKQKEVIQILPMHGIDFFSPIDQMKRYFSQARPLYQSLL